MRGGLPKIRTPRDHYEQLLRAKLIARRRAGGWSRTGRLGSAQVSLGLILGEIDDDDLVRSARALHVKLNGLANGLVLLFNGLVVGDDVDGVAIVFGVDFLQLHLNRTDVLRTGIGFSEIEFEDVALAAAFEFFDFIMVARDQAALHAEVADGALQFCLGDFEVGFGSVGFALGPAQFGGDFANLGGSIGLHAGDFRTKLRVALLLIFLDGLRQAAGLRQFVLRQA